MANPGLYDILSTNVSQSSWTIRYSMKVALFVISILNLNLGFSLCFYNGMNELWNTGLSLLFPLVLYLMTIVVVLTIHSHFSLRLSNKIAHSSVQIMVTVVHLSSKLLLVIIDVFTPVQYTTELRINQSINVWYNDGSVIYRERKHNYSALLYMSYLELK